MIKNETKHINVNEIENITSQAKSNNFYLVNLDGRKIQNEREYMKTIYKEFLFPICDHPDWDNPNDKQDYNVYMDCIEDLGWLRDKGYNGFVLIIDYYKSFLVNEPYGEHYLDYEGRVVYKFKEYLEIQGFNDITKYWESEVLQFSNYKIPHSFNIYLVDR